MADLLVSVPDNTRALPASVTATAAQISDSTAAGRSVLTAADAAAQRTALGLGTAATKNVGSGSSDLSDNAAISSTFAAAATPTGRTGTRRYDPARGVYNLHQGSLRKWRTAVALAKEGTAQAVLNCNGDSITYGQYATLPYRDGWVGRLRSKIDTSLGSAGGSGVSWMWQGYRTADTRLTFAGTWTDVAGYGPFRKSAANNADGSGASYIEFAPGTTCTHFVIHYVNQSAGAGIKWSVDGGSSTIIPTDTGGANIAARAVVSAGAAGVHTLRVWPNGGNIYIVGLESINGTSGARVSANGYPGLDAASIILNSTDGSAGYQYLDAQAPHLTTFMFGSNEFGGQQSVSTYLANMTTTINRALTTGDVLLITTVPRDVTSPTIAQDTYHQVAYTLADSLDVPVLDIGHRWSTTTLAGSLYYESAGSRIHPNGAGYRDIADAVFDVIMPRS